MNWRPLLWSLAAAAFFLAFTWGLRVVEQAGLVEGETARRTIQGAIGVAFAIWGNFMAKIIDSASASLRAAAHRQAIMRVGGWSMTLAGLAYAALWTFAPLAFADLASMLVIMAATAVMLGYMLWVIAICRRARTGHTEGASTTIGS